MFSYSQQEETYIVQSLNVAPIQLLLHLVMIINNYHDVICFKMGEINESPVTRSSLLLVV